MDMQDKEFDKLFSSKLEGLEMGPSAKVWKGINGELSGNKPKSLIPFLSIAASIIVLIAAGVLFIPKKDNVVKPLIKKSLAENKQVKVKFVTIMKPQPPVAPKISAIAVNKSVHLNHTNKTITPVITEKEGPAAKNIIPLPVNNPPFLAANTVTKMNVKQASVIDSSKTLAAVQPVVQQQAKPAVIAAVVPPAEKTTDAAPTKKHKIHGIGDLLNVAIAAVDKRKDKIIQFSDNDEDGTSITGVNLGVIKIKKEN